MLGQPHLDIYLNKGSQIDFKTNLVVGEYGCGKHTFIAQMASVCDCEVVSLNDKLTPEIITEISLCPITKIYSIDIDSLTEKDQNTLLKIIEEPTDNSIFFLISENKTYVLPTILNRCHIIEFKPYTKEVLEAFLTAGQDKSILEFCSTPGQVKRYNNQSLQIETMTEAIVAKLPLYNLAIILTIVDKTIKEGYNINVMLDILKTKLFKANMINAYILTNEYSKIAKDTRLNKEMFLSEFIIKLWEMMKAEKEHKCI